MSDQLRTTKRKVVNALRLWRALRITDAQGLALAAQRRREGHGLGAPLIVSLTSYPKRYPVLYRTLVNLLSQSMAADSVVLWLAHADRAALPAQIEALTSMGLTIGLSDDLRSYKKIIPQLRLTPEAFILIADDDVFYDSDWLRRIVDAHRGSRSSVVAHRAHRIVYDPDNRPAPYAQWRHDVLSVDPSNDIFATGVGGVLYPPGSLSPETTDEDRFMQLCPTADDVWLHWMARRGGSLTRTTSRRFAQVGWPEDAPSGLLLENWAGGNDRTIEAVLQAYGLPQSATGEPMAAGRPSGGGEG